MTAVDRPVAGPLGRTRGPRPSGQALAQVRTRKRLKPRDFGPAETALFVATALSSFAAVWIVFDQLTLLSGPFGFFVCWVITFLAMYWAVNLWHADSRVATDRVVAAVVTIGAFCLFTPLALLVGYLFVRGVGLLSWHLFTATQQGVLERCLPGFPCPKPGLLHAIVGTLEQIGLAAAIGVPAGILTAIYLNEVGGGRMAHSVRVVVTAMSGVPAILAGAFVYSFWVVGLHEGFSGFAGSMALSVILLPTVTRGTEEVLRIVPDDLREASQALAAPQWRTVWSVVLPTARSGLVTAVLLGTAVALGETAPLLLTIFGNTSLNVDPFHGPQSALPFVSYVEIKSPLKTDQHLAYAAALVLFILVFTLFILARVLSSNWLGNRFRSRLNRRMSAAAAEGVAEPGIVK